MQYFAGIAKFTYTMRTHTHARREIYEPLQLVFNVILPGPGFL